MIRAGAGFSTQTNAADAGKEAARQAMEQAQLSRADAVLLFATAGYEHQEGNEAGFRDLLEAVSEVAGTRTMSGCSGFGVLGSNREVEGSSGVAVLVLSCADITWQAHLGADVRERARERGRELAQGCAANAGSRRHLVLAMPDTQNCNPEELLSGFQEEAAGFPLFGGGASSDDGSGLSFQFHANTASTNAVASLSMHGLFSVVHGITQACFPIAPPFVVTKAEGHLVHELAGKPAYEVLAETLGDPRFQGAQRPNALFSGISVDPSQTFERGQYLIRNIEGVDPQRGVVAVSATVTTGQSLAFMALQPEKARQDMADMLSDLRQQLDGLSPCFGVYFNCGSRGVSLYQESGVDSRLLNEHFPGLPVIGFASGFEMAPISQQNFLHLYSGILVIVAQPA